MKGTLLVMLLLSLFTGLAQHQKPDSLQIALTAATTDTARVIARCNISHAFQGSKPDSALLYAQEAYFLSVKISFMRGESWALSEMAFAFNSLGNFPKALEYYIMQLKREEKRGYPDNIAIVYLNIALLYDNSKDYHKALGYAKTADSIIRVNRYDNLALYSELDVGEIYEKLNDLDSAQLYTETCFSKAVLAGNSSVTGTALNNLGNIFYKRHQLPEAADKYRSALPYLNATNDFSTYTESLLGLARIANERQQPDSAIHFARHSFRIASNNLFLSRALDASALLVKLFKEKNNTDSAFAYQEIKVALKDSIESRERIKAMQNLATEEELRQKEIAKQKREEVEDRKQKLQLLIIGIAIPIFFFISLVLSRRKVHKRLIEFSGIISILLLFEYITLLLHPFIAEKTNHSPIIEIIIFVTIAAIISPLHHRIERWLIKELTRLNALKHHHPPDTKKQPDELPVA